MPKAIKATKSRNKRAKSKSASKAGLFCAQNDTKTSQIRINTKEFSKLLLKWYKKVADDGFKDIEAPEFRTYQDPGQLRANSLRSIAESFRLETRHFYARLRCFLTFNKTFQDQYGDPISKKKLKACQLIAEGVPYRTVLTEVNSMKGRRLNLWSIGQLANHFINISTTWNKKSHNGMDYQSDF